jgi:flagellar motor protein MotB
MTRQRFGKRLVLAAFVAMMSISASAAQQPAEPAAKAGKPINAGDILSGELNSMSVRSGDGGQRVETYQITSEPRRLPPPNGLCNLETGPETFQLITSSDRQVAQLKKLAGKQVAVKVDEIACAQEAGQMSEAVVKRWSLVTTR